MDGDTVWVIENGRKVKIRIAEIDSPEILQAYGKEAKQFTVATLLGKEITLTKKDTDKYKRKVCSVSIQGVDFAEMIVGQGLAHISPRYCRNEALIEKYKYSKENNIGLFAHHWVSPASFRKSH